MDPSAESGESLPELMVSQTRMEATPSLPEPMVRLSQHQAMSCRITWFTYGSFG